MSPGSITRPEASNTLSTGVPGSRPPPTSSTIRSPRTTMPSDASRSLPVNTAAGCLIQMAVAGFVMDLVAPGGRKAGPILAAVAPGRTLS